MPKRLNPQQARELRQQERERYLAANSELPDAKQRWAEYEDLILRKYLPANFTTTPARFPNLSWRQQTLDRAWIERDLHHSREAEET